MNRENEPGRQEVSEAIAEFKRAHDQLARRLAALETSGSAEQIENRRVRLQDNGEWARHYSAVRMTVTTFLVSLSLGILSFKWEPSAPANVEFIALSGVIWMVAVLLFLVFTRLTYQEMERARLKRKELPDGSAADGNGSFHPRQDVASWIVVILTLLYGMVLAYLAAVPLWPFSPDFEFSSQALLRAAGNAVPGCTILVALASAVVTCWTPLFPGKKGSPRKAGAL